MRDFARGIVIILLFFTLISSAQQSEFFKGVDLSALQEVEDHGGLYSENGIAGDAMHILKNRGMNAVRLKLWHTSEAYNNLDKTVLLAQRIKALDLAFLLDFHFSDTWADPGRQSKPAVWADLSYEVLKDSLYHYTKDVIRVLAAHNALPEMVQIGNEIICGLLWDDGRVCDAFNTPQQWAQLAELINTAVRGIQDGLPPDHGIKIIIHIDRGGDNAGCRWFFDHLFAQNVSFDIIGLSFYPWWHGTLDDLKSNTRDLAQRYGKDILLAETAYPWSLGWNDDTHNLVGSTDQLLSGYPATVDGQRTFLADLFQLIDSIPDNKGLGLFYWAPEWISTTTSGSPWENVTLFDFQGEVLESTHVFKFSASQTINDKKSPNSFRLWPNIPNPFNPSTILRYELPLPADVTLSIYNINGGHIKAIVKQRQAAGTHTVTWNGTDQSGNAVSSGIYLCRLQTDHQQTTRKMVLVR